MEISLIQRQIAFNSELINELHKIVKSCKEHAKMSYIANNHSSAQTFSKAHKRGSASIKRLVELQKGLKNDLAAYYEDERDMKDWLYD